VLGDGPALTMPQKFYQRALSGDSDEIIAGAREFLKRKPFATYCDTVLMPALGLGRIDLATGAITPRQQLELRGAVVRVVEALGSTTQGKKKSAFRRQQASLLDETSPGRMLREKRLRRQQSGDANAVPTVSTGEIVLCVGLDALGDDLATELLVRILRDLHIDARHLALDEIRGPKPAHLKEAEISAVCIVSVDPRKEEATVLRLAEDVRARLPQTFVMALLLRDVLDEDHNLLLSRHIDRLAVSLEDAALEVAERWAADKVTAVPLKRA